MIELKQIEHQLIEDTNFLVIDVETTGLNAETDRITEIALVNVCRGEITRWYSQLINPEQYIPGFITELTGITNEMVYSKPNFEAALPVIKSFIRGISGSIILAGHNVSFDHKFLLASIDRCGAERITFQTLCTARLARRLKLDLLSKSLYSLSKHFRIEIGQKHRALEDATATAKILMHFLGTLTREYELETLDELLSFQHRKIFAASKLPKNIRNIKTELKNVPQRPGVYFMRNKGDELIYVGKAKNLSDRLRSYFYHNTSHTGKVRKMLREIHHVQFETTSSELSALILESKLIKKHKPRYNSATKRYGRFPFIKIDVRNSYPRAVKTYEIKIDGAKYYGPFRSSFTVNSLLENINRDFKLRKCDYKKLVPERGKSACMYYDIKQCKAPCNFTQTQADYRKEVKRVMNFLETEASEGAIQNLEIQMYELSDALKFEEASYIRDKILDLRRVIQNVELTSNETSLRNFVVKCKENNLQGLSEIFFVANGKLLKSLSINENYFSGQRSELKELICNIYFRGNLFSSVLYNNSGKFTKEDLDSMKILTNWIHQNNSPSALLKIRTRTTAEEILSFIYNR